MALDFGLILMAAALGWDLPGLQGTHESRRGFVPALWALSGQQPQALGTCRDLSSTVGAQLADPSGASPAPVRLLVASPRCSPGFPQDLPILL